MNRFMMIIVICIAVLMTGATSKKMADDNETGEYIFSRNIGPNVIQVVFDTITVSKEKAIKMGWSKEYVESQQGDMITVDYPKIIEEQVDTTDYQDIRRFELLDENGAVLLEREYEHNKERWYTSDNIKYIAFSEKQSDTNVDLHTEFYDENGNMLWVKDYYLSFNTILNNGTSVAGYKVYFNKFGEEIGTFSSSKLYSDFITANVINNSVLFSFRWCGNKTVVALADSVGDSKWEREFPFIVSLSGISSEGIIGKYEEYKGQKDIYSRQLNKTINIEDIQKGLLFVSNSGEIKWRKEFDGMGNVQAILGDNDRVYFMSSFGYVRCLSRNDAKELWKFTTKTMPNLDDLIFVDHERIKLQEIYVDANYIIVTAFHEAQNMDVLYILDAETGNLIHENHIQHKKGFLFQLNNRLYFITNK